MALGLTKFAFAEPLNVNLVTTVGEIRFELFPDKAPLTVANFLKYFEGGRFTGGSFYRVVRMDNQEQNTVRIEVIQGGMGGKEGVVSFDPIVLERTSETGPKYRHGTLSMARSEPDSGTSEFLSVSMISPVSTMLVSAIRVVRISNYLPLIDVFRLLHEFRLGAVSWLRRFPGDRE